MERDLEESVIITSDNQIGINGYGTFLEKMVEKMKQEILDHEDKEIFRILDSMKK